MEGSKYQMARQRAAARWAHTLKEARAKAEGFIEFAIPHERTNLPVKNAPHHVEWQTLLREHKWMVLIAPVEHGKTAQIGVGATLHRLGRDPTLRLALISNTQGQASKLLSSIKEHIQTNQRVRAVFPGLIPGDTWHSTAITVQRPTISKDPSIQALGVGSAVLGSRLDGIIVDDVLDFENTLTQEQLEKTVQWFDSSVFNRLTDGGFIWVIGTPWANGDLLDVLSSRPGWTSRRYAAVLNPDDPPAIWRPLWPEQFSRERLAKIAEGLTPNNFARAYFTRVRTDQTSRFQQAWIDQCVAAGINRTLLARAPTTPSGKRYPCFTGVDLGVGKEAHNDPTVLFTIALDERQRRIVVDVQSGRWQAPEILARIQDVHRRFDSIVLVEDNGAQSYLLQWASNQGLPVRPFTTGRNKYEEAFGVESIAVEMRSSLWIIPSGSTGQAVPEEVQVWIREMLFYSPQGHTGDHLMASWFAREGARQFAQGMTTQHRTLAR